MKIAIDPTTLSNRALQIMYFTFFGFYKKPTTPAEQERWDKVSHVIRTEYKRRGLWD